MDIHTVFLNINKIIERESKSSTYKFALLRGVIDIITENSPFIRVMEERVEIPLALLMEKWLIYYFPLLGVKEKIQQIGEGTQLAFEQQMAPIIFHYEDKYKLNGFAQDLKVKGIPLVIEPEFRLLLAKLSATIVNMPMRYIGNSLGLGEYSIFQRTPSRKGNLPSPIDLGGMIPSFGTFTIPIAYYEAFRVLGSFINGRDSILMQWAEMSFTFSRQRYNRATILDKLLELPVDERAVQDSNRLFQTLLQSEGKLRCIWTGEWLRKIDIDHVIPFSVWHNNELWNLLPTSASTNNRKRDKIPSPDQILRSQEFILHYWKELEQKHPVRFQKEIQTTLLGHHGNSDWERTAFNQLQSTCEYLINERGYQPWTA